MFRISVFCAVDKLSSLVPHTPMPLISVPPQFTAQSYCPIVPIVFVHVAALFKLTHFVTAFAEKGCIAKILITEILIKILCVMFLILLFFFCFLKKNHRKIWWLEFKNN